MTGPRTAVEAEIAGRHAAGDLAGAVALGYSEYGPEILAFLSRELADPELAVDAYSQLGSDLWRGIEGFRFACSFRTWAYRLARHAAYRLLRDPHLRRARRPLPGELSGIAEEARSGTAPWRRTAVKDALAEIREGLAPEERAILTLRVDRQMAWGEIAEVLADEGEALTEEAKKRKAAALRQRWRGLQRTLRERFAAAGLLGGGDG